MRSLIWFPGILWLFGMLMPEAMESSIESAIELIVDRVFRQGDPSVALLAAVVAAASVVASLVFGLARAILASGLARYRHDPAALTGLMGAVPKKELAAFGRGPAIAVARLRLRLATEQFRREMMIVGALVVVIILDWGGLADFARVYLPIVAALIPAMITFQLVAGRATGTLESLQQLPHPRRQVAVGHLLAVMVLAVPAVVIHAVARAAEGADLVIGDLIVRFAIYVPVGYAASAMVVWGTVRRVLILIAIVVVAPIALLVAAGFLFASSGFTPGSSAVGVLRALSGVGPLIPLALVLLAIAITNELFTFGLATYPGNAPRK